MTMNDISDIACNDQGFDVAVDLGPGWRIDAGAEPSMDAWLNKAKQDPNASMVGMYLTHNGIVRETPRAQVRRMPPKQPRVRLLVRLRQSTSRTIPMA